MDPELTPKFENLLETDDLRNFPVSIVPGIGTQYKLKLNNRGITTAYQLFRCFIETGHWEAFAMWLVMEFDIQPVHANWAAIAFLNYQNKFLVNALNEQY